MDESLTSRRRVEDEGLRVVNSFCQSREGLENKHLLTLCQQPRSNRGCKRYPDLLGVKRFVGGRISYLSKTTAQPGEGR